MLPAGARRLVAAGLLRAAVGAAQALRRSQAGVAEQGRRPASCAQARREAGAEEGAPNLAALPLACASASSLDATAHRPISAVHVPVAYALP
jgi:hypothetical protein